MVKSRILVPVLVVLCLAVTASAWAICTQIEGQITSIGDDQLTVATSMGPVVVQVTSSTIIKMGAKQIAFGDLKEGMTVRACGDLQDSTLVATRISVRFQGK